MDADQILLRYRINMTSYELNFNFMYEKNTNKTYINHTWNKKM